MRPSGKTAAELRAGGWSPIELFRAETSREARELVLRYELAGVPLLAPLGAASWEVYAPDWSHGLLRAFAECGVVQSPSLPEVARLALRHPEPAEWCAAVCSALRMGGHSAVHAFVYDEGVSPRRGGST